MRNETCNHDRQTDQPADRQGHEGSYPLDRAEHMIKKTFYLYAQPKTTTFLTSPLKKEMNANYEKVESFIHY